MKQLLVLGARSDIAAAVARRFAAEGWGLILAGRAIDELEKDATDLRIRYQTEVRVHAVDALAPESHGPFFDGLAETPDGVLCAIGYLGDQAKAEADGVEAARILNTNFNGCVSLLGEAARRLKARGSGFIVGIGSVAGDRGRKSNYYYGSAKAGFEAWLSGLRNSLYGHGVHVLTVKPGFVATKMTEGMGLPPLLTGSPDQVAADIYQAVRKGKNVIYTRWFWRYIMLVIGNIPEFLFKKLNL